MESGPSARRRSRQGVAVRVHPLAPLTTAEQGEAERPVLRFNRRARVPLPRGRLRAVAGEGLNPLTMR